MAFEKAADHPNGGRYISKSGGSTDMTTEERSHFVGIRVRESMARWLDEYAKANGITLSQVVRQALIEMKGKVEAVREAKNLEDVVVLRHHIGDMFVFKQTEEGLLLERVEPQTIVLGSGGRGQNARESRSKSASA